MKAQVCQICYGYTCKPELPESGSATPEEPVVRLKVRVYQLKEQSVAPHHVKVGSQNERYVIENMGTPGGTFVNDEPITDARVLQLDDRIKMGNLEVMVEDL